MSGVPSGSGGCATSEGSQLSPLSHRDKGLFTIAEAAEIAKVSPSTIRVWIGRHKLPTTRVLGRVMISKTAFVDCVQKRCDTPEGRAWRRKHASDDGLL